MATKQTAKKPAQKQASKPASVPKGVFTRRYAMRTLGVVAYTAAVAVLMVLILQAAGWHAQAEQGGADHNTAHTQPVPLAQNTQQVHACSDSITTLTSYTYSAHYFFDLQQQGYHLAGTLSQQASDGRGFTKADCATYFAVRAAHSADHIILQLFTRDAAGNLLPYQYKDLRPDTCYYSDTAHHTVCPNMPPYGIFVKD